MPTFFFNDCHPTLKADFVMANPPFNLSDWGADKLAGDVRWKYGTPPNGNANFAWIQHIIHHLAPTDGRVSCWPTVRCRARAAARVKFAATWWKPIWSIASWPCRSCLYTTQIPVPIWFFNKDKKQKG